MITYNRAKFLSDAIESVQKQTYSNWEMIIIDDASTDGTKSVVESYVKNDSRIQYVRNDTHLKISISRNKSLEHTQGEYIAILDSDDVWSNPQKLEKQIDFFLSNSGYVLVGSGVVVIDKDGKEIKRYLNPQKDKSIRQNIYLRNPFAHSSVMYRKDTALKVGGYNVSLETAEDYDLFFRLGTVGKLANLHDYLIEYRVHGSNITITDRVQTMGLNISLIKKYKGIYKGYYIALTRRKIRMMIYRAGSRLGWV